MAVIRARYIVADYGSYFSAFRAESAILTSIMFRHGWETLQWAIDNILYIGLSILGIHFIIQGEVLQKFNAEKTNFAEYDEPVTELPTFTTYILGSRSGRYYGQDFNISVETVTLGMQWFSASNPTNLTYGENLIKGSSLKLHFEAVRFGHALEYYKITPLSFSPSEVSSMFELKYIFENTTELSEVSLSVSTESGAVRLDLHSFNSDQLQYHGSLARTTLIILSARKYKFLTSKGCQEKSSNEKQLEKILLLCSGEKSYWCQK